MLISSKAQLIKNLDRVEGYLSSSSSELSETMAQYIARGRVFVTYIVNGKYHFAPSRFVGYKDNTLVKHQNNNEKDGTITTPAISKILGVKNQFYLELEEAYLTYCDWLGVTATEHKRTFWLLNQDIIGELTSEPFQEGDFKLRTHIVRERNNKVVQEAKRLFMATHGGKLGEGFIEAHHIIELSKIDGKHEVKPTDFAMVCSNCHSMLHRGNVSLMKLKKTVNK